MLYCLSFFIWVILFKPLKQFPCINWGSIIILKGKKECSSAVKKNYTKPQVISAGSNGSSPALLVNMMFYLTVAVSVTLPEKASLCMHQPIFLHILTCWVNLCLLAALSTGWSTWLERRNRYRCENLVWKKEETWKSSGGKREKGFEKSFP